MPSFKFVAPRMGCIRLKWSALASANAPRTGCIRLKVPRIDLHPAWGVIKQPFINIFADKRLLFLFVGIIG